MWGNGSATLSGEVFPIAHIVVMQQETNCLITLSMDQAPFGRSSSGEFQVRLASEFHCILKMRLLNNWIHVRDTLSVWKRSETCCLAFEGSDDEESDSEVFYKYIPPSGTCFG